MLLLIENIKQQQPLESEQTDQVKWELLNHLFQKNLTKHKKKSM